MSKLGALGVMLLCVACGKSENHPENLTDRPYYPTYLGVSGGSLYILSSNADQRYSKGNIVSVDIDKTLTQLKAGEKPFEVVTSSVLIPSLARTGLIFKNHLWVPHENEKTITSYPLNPQGITCAHTTGGLGQNCEPSQSLWKDEWFKPYFLAVDEMGLALVGSHHPAFYSDSPSLPKFYEIQGMRLENQSTQLLKPHGLNEIIWQFLYQSEPEEKRKILFEEMSKKREQVHVGGMVYLKSDALGLADHFLIALDHTRFSQDGLRVGQFVKLLAIPKSLLLEDKLDLQKILVFDLSEYTKSETAGPITYEVSNGRLFVYGILEGPEGLFKLEIKKDDSGKQVPKWLYNRSVCRSPQQLLLVPQHQLLLLSCFVPNPGQVIAIQTDTFEAKASFRLGKGPTALALSEDAKHVFVSYFNDHNVGVFELPYFKSLGFIF